MDQNVASARIGRPLAGRTALVTGGSRGIGRAIALAFGEAGANVAINYRSNKAEAAETLDRLVRMGVKCGAYPADIANHQDVVAMREEIRRDLGPVDVVVNNAGINRDKTFKRMDLESWEQVIDTNLTGTFNVTRVFLDDLIASGRGRVISISSIVGERGNFGQSNYAAAKAGILGFTKTLAVELARDRVTVNAIAPGFIETEMLAGVPEKVRTRILEQIPLGRFGRPEDVAAAAVFLASDGASFITGETLRVNGGQYV
ncbi:MAG TPA: beta-ketoacyl-ACP reductase [Candidatus Thermoplasmatota archaeon]|nr:beta-ketoacyl-ACP reductase [Candidatus Thermoplasmatota archaeon]